VTPNILHIDIDSLRADHLCCYGYHRNTSPNIDSVASEGVRFTDCWISDAPCLPSRTALWSGQVGWRNGVVNHAGSRASLRSEGSSRSYHDRVGLRGFTPILREQGYRTATVSSFGDRHAAWHWYAGFGEIMDTGGRGMEPDPLETVIAEGGAHCRGELPAYAEHLRLTERSELADRLVAAHPAEARETVGSTP